MSTQIKNVLKTDSKAYGVSGINIHYGSLFKVVHCTTKHPLHSLNIRWWPPGTCCHPHGREEKAGDTFPSLHVHDLAQKSKLVMLQCNYTQHPTQEQLLPLWWDFLWTSVRWEKWPFLWTGLTCSVHHAVLPAWLQSSLHQMGLPPTPDCSSTGWTGHTGVSRAASGMHLGSSPCKKHVSQGFEYCQEALH